MKASRLIVLVLSVLLVAGCSKPAPSAAKATAGAPEAHDHDHGHKPDSGHAHQPLMGGELAGIGEHRYNLEFKYDAARGVLQAWVLDAHAENFVRLTALEFAVREETGQKRTITLRAVGNDISGEKPGDTSSFEGEARWLGEIAHFDGIVPSITIRGTEFRDVDFHFHPKR